MMLWTLSLIFAATGAPMTEEPQSLSLAIEDRGERLEVLLVSLSPRDQTLSYSLDVTGQSTSRHRGKTSVRANERQVLSTIRVDKSDTWCVRAKVEEEGREPYEIARGECD